MAAHHPVEHTPRPDGIKCVRMIFVGTKTREASMSEMSILAIDLAKSSHSSRSERAVRRIFMQGGKLYNSATVGQARHDRGNGLWYDARQLVSRNAISGGKKSDGAAKAKPTLYTARYAFDMTPTPKTQNCAWPVR